MRIVDSVAPGATWLAALALTIAFASAPTRAQATHTSAFAQTLVDHAKAAHPDVDEIGILANTSHGCYSIASSDKSDVGEKCESDDIGPFKTGKPTAEKEGTGYDVSVLLSDAHGAHVGILSVGFKGGTGVTRASSIAKATKLAGEIAAKISSKATLLGAAM